MHVDSWTETQSMKIALAVAVILTLGNAGGAMAHPGHGALSLHGESVAHHLLEPSHWLVPVCLILAMVVWFVVPWVKTWRRQPRPMCRPPVSEIS
jgi:hypothetical protein